MSFLSLPIHKMLHKKVKILKTPSMFVAWTLWKLICFSRLSQFHAIFMQWISLNKVLSPNQVAPSVIKYQGLCPLVDPHNLNLRLLIANGGGQLFQWSPQMSIRVLLSDNNRLCISLIFSSSSIFKLKWIKMRIPS